MFILFLNIYVKNATSIGEIKAIAITLFPIIMIQLSKKLLLMLEVIRLQLDKYKFQELCLDRPILSWEYKETAFHIL